MNSNKSRYDLTSADTNIIGFDFQYLYFMNELLQLKKGQSVGFEKKDDVHIETCSHNEIINTLIQVKHTVQKTVENIPTNLSERDPDLWKTLSNWSKVICDVTENRETKDFQLAFLKKNEFTLATNKKIQKNKFITNLIGYKKELITFTKLKKYLVALNKDTKSPIIKTYILDVLNLNIEVLKEFLKKLNFVDTGDEIISSIKLNINGYMIKENRVNDVFNQLFSELKLDLFDKVKTGKHQVISFDEWINKYICIFENNRTTYLPVREFSPPFPDDLFQQPFIKELLAIGELKQQDLPQVTEFSNFMLTFQMNLKEWHNDGLITNIDLDNFHKNVFSLWRNTHKKLHRSTKKKPELDIDNSLKCLDEIRLKELKMITTDIGIDLSNGEFYYLSNERKIGWQIKWELMY
jgi:hypothetical protein